VTWLRARAMPGDGVWRKMRSRPDIPGSRMNASDQVARKHLLFGLLIQDSSRIAFSDPL